MSDRPNILIIEDDPALRMVLQQGLSDMNVHAVGTLKEARRHLEPLPDLVLTDINLVGESGITLARELRETHPRLPVLVMTAFGDLPLAVEALRVGAYDFLTKPLDFSVLRTALDRALETHALRREVRALRRTVREQTRGHRLIGESAKMRAVFSLLERVAPAPSSVLVHGESGTGKELVARALHDGSPRASGPFVAVNCGAIPDALLESELFGHVRGAFTDAQSRTGLVAQADGGTLFLDELGDLPLAMQGKLLRVLQERRVRPLGADQDVPVDLRIVAATHRRLEEEVEAGRFREDLLYRLDVIRIELPPLRERGRDILLLAQRFVEHHARVMGKTVDGIAPEAARQLLHYAWPGNVRELQNCMERAVVLSLYDDVQLDDLPQHIAKADPNSTVLAVAADPVAMVPLAEVERRYILQVLEAVHGKRAEAARVLGVDRKTLYRKLEKWKIP